MVEEYGYIGEQIICLIILINKKQGETYEEKEKNYSTVNSFMY